MHHREMEELARAMTGCDVALVSNHIKRGPEHAKQHEDLAPISFVHSDFAEGFHGDHPLGREVVGLEDHARAGCAGAPVTGSIVAPAASTSLPLLSLSGPW